MYKGNTKDLQNHKGQHSILVLCYNAAPKMFLHGYVTKANNKSDGKQTEIEVFFY